MFIIELNEWIVKIVGNFSSIRLLIQEWLFAKADTTEIHVWILVTCLTSVC